MSQKTGAAHRPVAERSRLTGTVVMAVVVAAVSRPVMHKLQRGRHVFRFVT
ncbi:MAG TPA: hypothetical protein VMM60_03795 [Ilumatobacter sp.]|nr:hypothetical protein [Ilumatobacter sp.]